MLWASNVENRQFNDIFRIWSVRSAHSVDGNEIQVNVVLTIQRSRSDIARTLFYNFWFFLYVNWGSLRTPWPEVSEHLPEAVLQPSRPLSASLSAFLAPYNLPKPWTRVAGTSGAFPWRKQPESPSP